MTDFEWKEFIIELNQTDKKVDLKKECKARGVGLNTLYRKVNSLKETDSEIFNEFIKKHPYSPRDISTIDFEQLMRESIICGVSQKDLENKYGVPKRTIQRKFRKIHDENPKGAKKQAIQHYKEEIQRIDNQININNESDERE